MERHQSRRKRARNSERNQELQLLYHDLVLQLDSINQSRKLRTLCRSFTDSTGIIKAIAELQDSPRSLMHSLQEPLAKYDLAVSTPLRERRAGVESGRVKGRRLFDREEDHEHVIIKETEVRSVFSYDSDDENEDGDDNETLLACPYNSQHPHFSSSSSSNSSFVCEDCLQREMNDEEEQEVKKEVSENVQVEDKRSNTAKTVKEKRLTMVIMLWLAIVALVFAIGFVSIRSFSGYRKVGRRNLVPT